MIRNPEGRRNWIRVVNRSGCCSQKHWQPNKHHRVCSKHFVETRPTKENPDPELHMGYEFKATTPRREIHRTCQPNSSKRFKREQTEPTDEAVGEVNSTLEENRDSVSVTGQDTVSDGHSYNNHCVCGPECTCIGCADKQQHVNRLQSEVDELKAQIHGMK